MGTSQREDDKAVAVAAAVKLDEEDEDAIKLFPAMLSFYGVELQSHASIGLGLVVALFAIIQAYRVAPSSSIVYSLLAGAIGAGIVHQALRFYMWGKLASGILYANDIGFRDAKRMWNEDKKHENPYAKWEHLLGPAKVLAYNAGAVMNTAGPLIALRVLKFDREKKVVSMNYWTLLWAFEFSFVASFFLIFGGSELLPFSIVALGAFVLYYVVERLKVVRRLGDRGRKAVGLRPRAP